MAIDFKRDVLERSQQVPVVVDFWAPWCGPCRVLGPILEKLAEEAKGRFELVKIDTDEQTQIATDWHVRGIPAVKLFHQGKVVAEFVGALPSSEVQRWLDQHLPDPRQNRLASIVENWDRREGDVLIEELEEYLAENPEVAEGRLQLAQAVVTQDPSRARKLLAELNGDGPVDQVSDVETLAELMELTSGMPPKLSDHFTAARQALAARDWDRALERLIDAVTADRGFQDELARRAAVALFRMLGHHHELTLKHQRRLAMALHV